MPVSNSPDGRQLKRREGVLAQEAKGRTVLLCLDDGSYYATDEVGGLVWELCDGERTLGEVAAAVGDEFDAPPETVMADVLEFVVELESEGLLVEAPYH